ncbi:MAG: hypothetical protein C4527_19475 [Candidatus Omnitrophota bacterium]|jgi:hypothetical protein|nr:MAG: hypothetical protein C4527_19475 [Candidatus Omnitrophota bacterium]
MNEFFVSFWGEFEDEGYDKDDYKNIKDVSQHLYNVDSFQEAAVQFVEKTEIKDVEWSEEEYFIKVVHLDNMEYRLFKVDERYIRTFDLQDITLDHAGSIYFFIGDIKKGKI